MKNSPNYLNFKEIDLPGMGIPFDFISKAVDLVDIINLVDIIIMGDIIVIDIIVMVGIIIDLMDIIIIILT